MFRTIGIDEAKVLKRLRFIAKNHKQLTATDAWKCFSTPNRVVFFEKKNVGLLFSKKEVAAIKEIKKRLVSDLEIKSLKRCSYCKRTLGNYGWSWDIEHILCKSNLLYRKYAFSPKNITVACRDCNYNKNNHVDKKPPYDIIVPSAPGFDYGQHLNYFNFSTEKICVVKYKINSSAGKNTYDKLKLNNAEFLNTWGGLSKKMKCFLTGLDSKIEQFKSIDAEHEVANFLLQIKSRMASK